MANSTRNPIGANQDITARNDTNDYKVIPYAATISISPTKRRTVAQIGQLTGALTINLGTPSTTAAPYIGDELTLLLFGDATGRTVTFGTNTAIGAATLVLAAGSKRGSITFVFDGTVWVETGRVTQA